MTEPNVVSYAGSFTQADKDAEHLRILAICHYIAGALTMLFSCVFIFHIIMGVAIITGKSPFPMSPPMSTPMSTTVSTSGMRVQTSAPVSPEFFGYMFLIMGCVAVLVGWSVGIATIFSGLSIARRRNRMFSLVIAVISCAFFPIGTALGVFTLLLLLRDSVKAGYARDRLAVS